MLFENLAIFGDIGPACTGFPGIRDDEIPSVVATGASVGDRIPHFPSLFGNGRQSPGVLSAIDADDRIGNFHRSSLAHATMSGNPQPVIVLVEPQKPENIGMCARAMLNCGLNQLRLVRPRAAWPHEAARRTAADADEVLEGATLFDRLDEAIADCSHVVATTARPRAIPLPVAEAEEAAERVVSWSRAGSRVAILFGAEACGLDTDSVSRADCILKFATNPDFPTLNLAQGVLLFAWEWRAAMGLGRDSTEPGEVPVERGALTHFFDRLETALDERGFFLTPQLKPTTLKRLRSLFVRAAPAERDLALLHGALTSLLSVPRKREGAVED